MYMILLIAHTIWKHKLVFLLEIVHKLEPIFSLHKDGIDAVIRDVLLKLRQNVIPE